MAHETFDFNNHQNSMLNQLSTAYMYLFQSKASQLLLNQTNETKLSNKKTRCDSEEETDYNSNPQCKKLKLFHQYERNSLDSNDKFQMTCQSILDFIRPNLSQYSSKPNLHRDYLDNLNFVPIQTEKTIKSIDELESVWCPICQASLNSSNLKSHLENELNELNVFKKNTHTKIDEKNQDEKKQTKKVSAFKIQSNINVNSV